MYASSYHRSFIEEAFHLALGYKYLSKVYSFTKLERCVQSASDMDILITSTPQKVRHVDIVRTDDDDYIVVDMPMFPSTVVVLLMMLYLNLLHPFLLMMFTYLARLIV